MMRTRVLTYAFWLLSIILQSLGVMAVTILHHKPPPFIYSNQRYRLHHNSRLFNQRIYTTTSRHNLNNHGRTICSNSANDGCMGNNSEYGDEACLLDSTLPVVNGYAYQWILPPMTDNINRLSTLYISRTRLLLEQSTRSIDYTIDDDDDLFNSKSANRKRRGIQFYLCFEHQKLEIIRLTPFEWSAIKKECLGEIDNIAWPVEALAANLEDFAPYDRINHMALTHDIRQQLHGDECTSNIELLPLEPWRILKQFAPALNIGASWSCGEPEVNLGNPEAWSTADTLSTRLIIVPVESSVGEERPIAELVTAPFMFKWTQTGWRTRYEFVDPQGFVDDGRPRLRKQRRVMTKEGVWMFQFD